MLKNITGWVISRDHAIKIRPHPGATSVDMINYIKPELRHKPDIIFLHYRKNDITNDMDTIKNIKKLVKEIKENHGSMDIVFLGFIKRFIFIDNNNLNESCLYRGKVQLNRRGSYYLGNSF